MKRHLGVLCALAAATTACGGAGPTNKRSAPPRAPEPAAPGAPVWASAASFEAYCSETLAETERLREGLRAPAPRTGGDTLAAYNEMLRAMDTASGWAALMFSVHPDESMRAAAGACREKISKLQNDINLDRALYDALVAIDREGFDPVAHRALDRLLREYRRSGVDKDEATRARLTALHGEMVSLGMEIGKAVREDVRSIRITDPSALDGLPDDYVAAHPPDEAGVITITTDYPDFFPFQTYAADGELRKRLYQAFMQRGYPANKARLEHLLRLRREYAGLLGYASWADYMAEDKMVGSAAAIEDFIEQLEGIVRPRMAADLDVLLVRKRRDLPAAAAIEVWDRFYYAGKVREEQFDFDARSVRPYFSYPKVKRGIFALYGQLFGVRFEQLEASPAATGTAAVWADGVEAWRMLSSDGRIIGRFYLDMHPREGKYKHAAMFPIQTGLQGGAIPMASLVCNFPDPADGDGKALMEHDQVETYFHEFGHLIHHLLARNTDWVNLAGINVEWDFVEAPSQILEEWAWDPTVLAGFAHHVDSGEPISAETVRRMRAAEEFGKGTHVMRQLFYTAYSFYLHERDPAAIDLEAFTDEMYRRFSPYPRLPDGHAYANFGHLVGYSSMYYTYQWSLVIAKDLFTRFKAAGLLDPAVARAYRESILEPGGTDDAARLVERFLGRPYNLEAYRAWLEE